MRSSNNFHDAYAEMKAQELIKECGDLREQAFLSQKQVSQQLGLTSHGNLTLIEQGKTIPRLDRFLRILSVYGYTLEITKKDKGAED